MNFGNETSTRTKHSSCGWMGLLALLVATVLLVVLLAGHDQPAYAQSNQKKTAPVLSKLESWQNDLKAWESHWNTLIAQRPNVDTAKWGGLESDLNALAKKYGQANEEHVRKQSTDKPTTLGAGLSDCPPRDDIPGYRCYLFPGPKGTCRYVCTPIGKKL